MRYLEFAVTSNFSFLRGASHPEELMVQAAHAGLAGIGLTDRNSVAGVVRAHVAKREHDLPLRYHPGARLIFADGTPDILAYPRDRAGWGRLTRLLTIGNRRAEKGECILTREDLVAHAFGLELIAMGGNAALLSHLRTIAHGRVRLAATMLYRGNDRARLARSRQIAREAQVPLIAVNDVIMHHPERRPLADVLTCIREKLVIDRAGRLLAANAERHLKPPVEMTRLFRDAPEAIEETLRLSERLTFSLDELRYEYPDEQIEDFSSPLEALEHLTNEGAKQRYPDGIPDKVRQGIAHELKLIAERQYAPYFLTVYDIVRYARSKNILCQGRGSAANSTICYCLHITEVDPTTTDLLFERFISTERDEPPDIDVDFEHERREEVIQYIYRKYDRECAGIAATVISYRGRSAIREVGKAFGLSEDAIGALSSSIWGGGGGAVTRDAVARTGIDPQSPRMRKITALASKINGFPRHLSQHVGGFVITRSRLDEVVPIGNGAMKDRTFVEWDKDDLDALGILKIDVLSLGMLSCIRKALNLVEKHYPGALQQAGRPPLVPSMPSPAKKEDETPRFDLSSIPREEKAVYRMLSRADSLGVFQVESRAQMSMLPRLKPEKFYDLVIEVAIVRPGPIQGNMVHPYLRRRQKQETIDYPSKQLEAILQRTLGVPLFQEQAMKIAIVAGGFTPGEADRLRRAMATFKRTGTIGTFRDKMINGMLKNDYKRDFAERCFQQIEGFGEYGFPESHAASFALLVYASAWLKCRYPDVFATALLNAQPMGFYAPSQIVRDTREHGVEVRPPDINFSNWDSTLELGQTAAEHLHDLHKDMRGDVYTTHAIRLGLREIKGLKEKDGRRIVERRTFFTSPRLPGEVGERAEAHSAKAGEPGEGASRDAQTSGEAPSPASPSLALQRVDLSAHAGRGDYDSVRDLWLRTGLSPHVLERLADADAFASLGLTRRDALWAAKALGRVGDRHDDLPLFAASMPPQTLFTSPRALRQVDLSPQAGRGEGMSEPEVHLPPMPIGEEVVNDYRFLRLSLRAHPCEFLRGELNQRGILRNGTLRTTASDTRATVSGLVTCRQRPGSANGVIFMTIEDETAMANIIVWPKTFERFRPVVLGARYVAVRGNVQEESGVIHVVAEYIEDLTLLLGRLTERGMEIDALARCDEVRRPIEEMRKARLNGRRENRLERVMREVPELAADLDTPARGSAHAPSRKAG